MRDECGATAIEYALISSFIAIVIVAGITAIGTTLKTILLQVGAGFPA